MDLINIATKPGSGRLLEDLSTIHYPFSGHIPLTIT